MFFMNKLIVPPNRFRPESEGGFGGGGGSDEKSFLHPHSAMIMKVLKINIAIKDAILM
jgi:DNA-directed RNA polymerase I subunit RPA1